MEKPMMDTKPAWAAAPNARISSTAPSRASNDRLSLRAAVKCAGPCRVAALRPARPPFAAPGDSNKSAARLAEKPGKNDTTSVPNCTASPAPNWKSGTAKASLTGPKSFARLGRADVQLCRGRGSDTEIRAICVMAVCGPRPSVRPYRRRRSKRPLFPAKSICLLPSFFPPAAGTRRRIFGIFPRHPSYSPIIVSWWKMPGTGTWNFLAKFPIKSVSACGNQIDYSRVAPRHPGETCVNEQSGNRAEQYRRYAAECVRLASLTDDALEKGVLLQMAEQWQQIAARADKNEPRT